MRVGKRRSEKQDSLSTDQPSDTMADFTGPAIIVSKTTGHRPEYKHTSKNQHDILY